MLAKKLLGAFGIRAVQPRAGRLFANLALTLSMVLVVAASAGCGAAAPTCRGSYVVDQGTWLANGDSSTGSSQDGSDPGYWQYTDDSGYAVGDGSSSQDPSAGDPSGSDPYGSDPSASDPSGSDPSSDDSSSGDPSGDDTSTESLKHPRHPRPAAQTRLEPNASPGPVDPNGCYRCALSCTVTTAPSAPMVADGASDRSAADACRRAQRAMNAWAAHTSNTVGSCTPAS